MIDRKYKTISYYISTSFLNSITNILSQLFQASGVQAGTASRCGAVAKHGDLRSNISFFIIETVFSAVKRISLYKNPSIYGCCSFGFSDSHYIVVAGDVHHRCRFLALPFPWTSQVFRVLLRDWSARELQKIHRL